MKYCDYCHQTPAKGYLRDRQAWLCGVCWHRLEVARDLARRVISHRKVA